MKSNVKILLIIVIILVFGIGYYLSSMIYYLNRPYLTSKGSYGSKSITESKDAGLYIGEYETEKNFVKLKDGSILKVKNAWIEHQYRYKKIIFFFIHIKQKTKGFYLVIPPLEGKLELRQDSIKPIYFLDLQKDDEKYTSSPGFGFSDHLGYQVYLDELPQKIRFNVIQKDNENDSWENAKIIDTITYIKDFK
jgi:hypothetical protein